MKALLAAVAVAVPTLAQAEPAFRPEQFFAGTTRAAGVTSDAFGAPTGWFTGETRGRRHPDGSTIFEQTIRFDDGAVRRRRWRIVSTGPGVVAVTGSDVVGEGRGVIDGRMLRLSTTIRWHAGNPLSDLDFEQAMTLRPGGRSLDNASTVRKLGFVISRAQETFRRIGGGR